MYISQYIHIEHHIISYYRRKYTYHLIPVSRESPSWSFLSSTLECSQEQQDPATGVALEEGWRKKTKKEERGVGTKSVLAEPVVVLREDYTFDKESKQ